MRILAYLAAAAALLIVLLRPQSMAPGIIVASAALIHLACEFLSCAAGDDVAEHIAYHCRDSFNLLLGDLLFVAAFGLGVAALLDPGVEIGLIGAVALSSGNAFYTHHDWADEPALRPELRHQLVEV